MAELPSRLVHGTLLALILLFRLAVRLMMACSEQDSNLSSLIDLLGQLFQIQHD